MKSTKGQVLGGMFEHAVVSKLLGLGHEVAIPVVDLGVDLVVDYNIRVQVKGSSAIWNEGRKSPHFIWGRYGKPLFAAKKVDIYIFVGRSVDLSHRFWVVPIDALGGEFATTSAISIPLEPNPRHAHKLRFKPLWQYEEAWHVLVTQ